MSAPIPHEWFLNPVHTIVVGDGPFAAALAFVLGGARLDGDTLLAGPQPMSTGFPRVLSGLQRVIQVVGGGQSAADALHWHDAAWAWVEKLSSQGADHEQGFLFVVPRDAGAALEDSLATGLAVGDLDFAAHGYAMCRAGIRMAELVELLRQIGTSDLVRLRNRRAADGRRRVLTKLMEAERSNDASVLANAASEVTAAFDGKEHDLDLFCRAPSHANGNRLRSLLKRLVTAGVTSIGEEEPADQMLSLLSPSLVRQSA
jgi:hypothetical protein